MMSVVDLFTEYWNYAMSKKVREQTIDPKHFYSLGEIVDQGIIPGINTVPKASRLVRNDALFNKRLRAQMVAAGGRVLGYKVRGSNIINYLAEQDSWRK